MAGLGDLGGLLKHVMQMQGKMKEVKKSLEASEVEGQAGDGAVVARLNGRGEMLGITIRRDVVDPENVELLEDLVRAAVCQASEKSQEMMQQEMRKVTGGLNIPGLDAVLGGLS